MLDTIEVDESGMGNVMNLVKCENGHFFDLEKFLSCPHCSNEQAGIEAEKLLGKNQHDVSTGIPQPAGYPGSELPYRKTVGWLVCISGMVSGESFCIREGENHIGRAANMDIALLYEPTVSRKTHAVITYQPEQRACVLYPQESAPTLCNDRVVKIKRTLKNRDVITFGTCTFVFVAFCGKAFAWEDYTE